MFRLVTYNVHRCLGRDRRILPERIAEVIASCDADIVALQELDVGRRRSGGIDQAQVIARHLQMHLHFHPALRVHEEAYGDAILTFGPSRLVKAGALPGLAHRPGLEPRGALWVRAELGNRTLDVINTHLGLRGAERVAQINTLLGSDWVGAVPQTQPLMLAGDFNAVPSSPTYRRAAAALRDAQDARTRRPRPTFPARFPVLRLDHVFVNSGVDVLETRTLRTPLARRASDHVPLVVDFTFAESTP